MEKEEKEKKNLNIQGEDNAQPTNNLPIARLKRWLKPHANFRNLRVEQKFWIEFEKVIRHKMKEIFEQVCDFQKEFLPKRGTLMRKSLLQYLKYKFGVDYSAGEQDPFN